uniref:Hexosyltransferase n=1 Tax=Anthurium amnicola TaxID=1678845 RepID=A0A1D1Y5P5_9ARAE
MRRRAPARRRFASWIWCFLVISLVVVLVLFVVHHRQKEQSGSPLPEVRAINRQVHHESFNLTKELLSTASFARQLVDQMTLAKAYLVMAKVHGNLKMAWELSSQIRNCQRLLSQAAVEGKSISLEEAQPVVSRLAELIYKAQDAHYDIATTITTLRSHVRALEDRVTAATVQSAEFGQLAAKAKPKYIHCLNIKLTVDWFNDSTLQKLDEELRNSTPLVDNHLYHFCVFSDNVLATSVVVNSTISHVDHPQQLVFHVVTDSVNYLAMRAWFLMNDFKGCTVEVKNIEEFSWLNASYSPVVKQLLESKTWANYFDHGSQYQPGEARFNSPKFVPLLNHLRFYIPQIFPSLEKVIFLDDDVVVQKDLTPLFSLDLHGNVNGAVETCLEAFHRYYKYLNFSNPLISSKFDPQACGWSFGMNIFDLIAWKKANLTAKYHYWQEQNSDQMLWKSGILPPGLLTFYGLTEPLDRRWHVLGLGYDPDIDSRLIESAAVVHFNGNMKPWLKLAISRYQPLWERHINYTNPRIKDCFAQ